MLADALIVMAIQKGICRGEKPLANLDQLIMGINDRIREYWSHGKPIIFIQNNDAALVRGTDAWCLMDEIHHTDEDYYLQKAHCNAFCGTKLQAILQEHQVEDIEFCGTQIEGCLDVTMTMAHGLGYEVQLQQGLSSTHDNQYMTAEQTIAFYEHLWQERFLAVV